MLLKVMNDWNEIDLGKIKKAPTKKNNSNMEINKPYNGLSYTNQEALLEDIG